MNTGEHPPFRAGSRKKSGCISLPCTFGLLYYASPILTPVKINRGSLEVVSVHLGVIGERLACSANPSKKTGCMDFTHARDRLNSGPRFNPKPTQNKKEIQ
jgi:hypothetical protein